MRALIIAVTLLAASSALAANPPCYRDFYSGDGKGCWVVDPGKPWNP